MKPDMNESTSGQTHIYPVGDNPVLSFAAEELRGYLMKMTGKEALVVPQPEYAGGLRGGITLAQAADLSVHSQWITANEFDDAISIDIDHGGGTIVGANPRSVLLAVYRFLREAGCRWVRPGIEGELVPHRPLSDITVRLEEKPSYRHRAICIEGAVGLENVLDVIDWAPKVGFSGYFMQFREGFTFFDRWYSHRNNPTKIPERISMEQARQFTRTIEAALAKRGMLYHAVGHGWTCEAFGIPGLGWDPVIQDWPEEVISSLAEVNGKRLMWQNIPLNTSLCFSNPQVRQRVVSCVAEYLNDHPNIQALHFWLDDGFNNECECAECQKMRPSDYYVILLNELDEVLTSKGYPGKVVFLAYADSLWPPVVERIKSPERFILMFAPITRSYRRPLYPQDAHYQPPPYVRNRLTFSNNNDEQLSFLRQWQVIFPGDSFIYDYHLWRPGAYTIDPDHIFLSRLLSTDLKNLKNLGLNGYVSCQIQRFFYPTGLAMYVMGRTLWDDTVSFDALLDEYFTAAFGAEWQAAKAYLIALSDLQDVVPVLEKGLAQDPNALEKLRKGLEINRQFSPVIEHNLGLEQPAQRRSWFYLHFHRDLMERYLSLLIARAEGKTERVSLLWSEIKSLLQQHENDIQPVFDVCSFIDSFDAIFE